ncbi:hypothetical protein HELRODRAFT_165950 [Helobdella robusta]|uniref:Uncharacterized protein n=1 Tax=Helobdella robusta TaxID=6412 RepID=T1EXI0_HELRO|nr:hypothetical protein HELRODRAFT_165950 [Helobdella robusta]ESN90301.1 hypothetical protein HELRODRAFT_165950 [Helobdella robusta]
MVHKFEVSVVLNVGSSYHNRLCLLSSQSRGVHVSVHNPGSPPDLKRGLIMAPGTENIVTIVQTERFRLDKPHNNFYEKITLFGLLDWHEILPGKLLNAVYRNNFFWRVHLGKPLRNRFVEKQNYNK